MMSELGGTSGGIRISPPASEDNGVNAMGGALDLTKDLIRLS